MEFAEPFIHVLKGDHACAGPRSRRYSVISSVNPGVSVNQQLEKL
jgi:hypothetical protein